MASKLNEILKPKISKNEVIALTKLIFRRFAEILEKNRNLCVGYWCEECAFEDDCPLVDESYSEMYDVVSSIEESLNISMLFEWEGEFIILTIYRVAPDENEKNVFCYTLKVASVASAKSLRNIDDSEFDFEPETLAERRASWRYFNERFSRYHVEDALEWFFRGDAL